MTIRNKLAILFSGIFAIILLFFALSVYYFYKYDTHEQFYKRLKQQGRIRASLLYETKIAPSILQTIYKNSAHSLIHEEVAIYDTTFYLLYHDAVDIDFVKETESMINAILQKKEIKFWQEDHQVIGFTIKHNRKTYVIIAAAVDEYGLTKIKNLRYTIIVAFIVAILLTVFAGRSFAKQALKPVTKMVSEVEEITATHLHLRVNEGNYKDEISELAITFNQMLNRLEHSFEAQKQFVSNISHELRTPLSTIITELELSVTKERGIEEYKTAIWNALSDSRKLAKLTSSLLDFAKASYDPLEITFKEVRLDEILLDAQQEVIKANAKFKISIGFDNDVEYDFTTVKGNEYLLKTAFANLMENACKFSSDHHCDIHIAIKDDLVVIKFYDKGIGISKQDLENIFNPFYRGTNKEFADGNGIGLSLTQKIIRLHNGTISVHSEINEGSLFLVEMAHISLL